MIIHVLLFASTVALLSQVTSTAVLEPTAMNKVMESVKDARRNANDESEAASAALQKLNEAIKDSNKKLSSYFEAMKNRTDLDKKKLDLDAKLKTANDDLETKKTALSTSPNNNDLKSAKDAAEAKLSEIKEAQTQLDKVLTEAINTGIQLEGEYLTAQKHVQQHKEEYDELKRMADFAETSTRRPTILGNIIRSLAKINLEIADSLDRIKANIRG